jgi:hypothetical protein
MFAKWYVDDLDTSRRTSVTMPLAQQFGPNGWLDTYYWTCQSFYPLDGYMMGNFDWNSYLHNYHMTVHVSRLV